jgi:hypothetical protein
MHRRRPLLAALLTTVDRASGPERGLPDIRTTVDRASGPERGLPDIRFARAALPLSLIFAASTFAQDAPVTIDANVPPARLWTHHLTFPESIDGVRSIAFAPDRESIYVHYAVPVVDAWSLLVYHWPEIFGALVGLIALFLLFRWRRIVRHAQIHGAPHCRRCNYELSAHVTRDPSHRFVVPPGTRCPECGVPLAEKRPRAGKDTLRRLAPVSAVLLIATSIYSTALIVGVPREGRVSGWFEWPSNSLARFASARLFHIGRIRVGARTVRVDVPTGRVDRMLATHSAPAGNPIAVTPDGRGIVVTTPEGFKLIDSRTGRTQSVAAIPRSTVGFTNNWFLPIRRVVGFLPDGHAAVIQDGQSVRKWNLIDGRNEHLLTLEYEKPLLIPSDGTGGLHTRHADMLMEWTVPGELRLIPTKAQHLDFMRDLGSPPLLIAKGGRIVSVDEEGLRIESVEDNFITAYQHVSAGPQHRLAHYFAVSTSEQLVAIGSYDNAVLIRNLDRSAWLAYLSTPPGAYAAHPAFAADDRWLAAIVQTGTTTFRHELVLWNLAEILESSEHAQPTEPTP